MLKINCISRAVAEIDECRSNLVQDDKGYRFHTPLTRLSREFRKFLQIDGEMVYLLDIKNSQPYFLNYILKGQYVITSSNHRATSIIREGIGWVKKRKRAIIPQSVSIMITNSDETPENTGIPALLFGKLTSEGALYERLVADIEQHRPWYFKRTAQAKEKRDLTKNAILPMLYAANDSKEFRAIQTKYWAIHESMERLFPDVMKLIKDIKSCRYEQFAWLLQRVESFAIFAYACKAILQEIPDAAIFTIHDCIVVKKSIYAPAMEIMRRAIGEFMLLPPTVSFEPCL